MLSKWQNQVQVAADQAATGGTVGQIGEGVMHEGESQARQGLALFVMDQGLELVFGKAKAPGVPVVPAQPGRIQPDQVNRQAVNIQADAVTQVPMG